MFINLYSYIARKRTTFLQSDAYYYFIVAENHHPENEIKTTVSILPATDKQTFVPSTQDASTFITSTIGTTQPEYLDNHSEENINEPEGSDIGNIRFHPPLFIFKPQSLSLTLFFFSLWIECLSYKDHVIDIFLFCVKTSYL